MSSKYAIPRTKQQEMREKSSEVSRLLERYLDRLLVPLDAYLDKRLVETFLQGIRTIIEARNQAPGLAISELGAILTLRSTSERRGEEDPSSVDVGEME